MRYPGPSRQDIPIKCIALCVAFLIFGLGLYKLNAKYRPAETMPTSPSPTPVAIATPTPISGVHFQFFDAITMQPIIQQAVTLLPGSSCDNGSCPGALPISLVTDNNGEVIVEKSLLKEHLTVHSIGYKKDTYFSSLTETTPDTLIVYETLPDHKTSYNTTNDTVIVALTPLSE